MLDLVPQGGGLLEFQRCRRRLHAVGELGHQVAALPGEKHLAVAHVLGIALLVDQTDAGRGAAADLVLQAGAGAVAKEAVVALARPKQLLQKIPALPRRRGAGRGTASGPRPPPRPTT